MQPPKASKSHIRPIVRGLASLRLKPVGFQGCLKTDEHMLWCIKEHDWQGEWQQAAPEGRQLCTKRLHVVSRLKRTCICILHFCQFCSGLLLPLKGGWFVQDIFKTGANVLHEQDSTPGTFYSGHTCKDTCFALYIDHLSICLSYIH